MFWPRFLFGLIILSTIIYSDKAFHYLAGYMFCSYMVGSIPFGLILTKVIAKKDVRTIGSGNIGATNVLRAAGKKVAFFTLLLDASKAAFPVLIFIGIPSFQDSPPELLPYNYEFSYALWFGLFAILGHCFPVWLKFKGGKGVATTLGALLAAVPYAGLAACATWLLMAFIFKYSSLSALIAVAAAPLVTLLVYGSAPAFLCFFITLLVWAQHADNIKRLLNGTEPKIGEKKDTVTKEEAE